MKVALLLLALVAVVLSFKHDERLPLTVTFQRWIRHYGKIYASQDEYQNRFTIFQENMKKAAELNAQNTTARFGATKFADLTHEEFAVRLGMKGYVPKVTNRAVTPAPQTKAPANFDWRNNNGQSYITAVKDQGQCGSCWAFATTESIESAWILSKGISASQMPPLAPQQIVDCDTTDQGCNGGDPPTAYQYVISAGGIETNQDYPYTAQDGNCNFDSSSVYATISNFQYAIPQGGDENTMANVLATTAPLAIIVDASSWQYYTGGVLSSCGTSLDHAVMAVGYSQTAATPYWIVRNSWGSDWGENGFIRLQFGQNTCGITSEVTYAVV